ncbi:MAG: hypothetical protein XD58_1972 [Thermotoga sp. 50_1627]|nr:MAG: hypothetical protein XD58_1972 [Thermotoga sp. 50_1627]
MILEPRPSNTEKQIEQLATKVLLKSIELLGGLTKIAQHRNLTWLASLARACIALVLREEYMKSEKEIAEYLGVSTASVRNMLRASVDVVKKRLADLDRFLEEEKGELEPSQSSRTSW